MEDSAGGLVLLQDCHDQMELAQVRSLLEAHDIAYVVQGEHHSQLIMGALGGGPVTPRVLVDANDHERAAALLGARPNLTSDPETTPLADAVCPVHERAAIATCDRCGTFLCSSCDVLGEPPLCEDCVKHEASGLKRNGLSPGGHRTRFELMVAVPFAVLAVIAIIMSLLGQW